MEARVVTMLTDPTTEAAVAGMLTPGEALRVHGDVNVAHGDTGALTDTELLDDPSAPHNRANRMLDRLTRTRVRKVLFYTVLSPLLAVAAVESIGDGLSDRIDRLVGGVTCRGPRGSLARRMEHAFTMLGGGGRADHLAVTDRRLLLLRRRHRGVEVRFDHVWEVPLDTVARARPRPRGLLRRRIELLFADGSHIVLALPTFQAPSPARVCEAVGGDRSTGLRASPERGAGPPVTT
jgi:hypothetical protein